MKPSLVGTVAILVLMSSWDLIEGRPRISRQANMNIDTPVVNTSYGPVKGRRFDFGGSQTLEIYLGVPYARPPTGAYRFARPVAPDAWTQTRDATVHGAKCIQRIITGDPPLENVPFSEDCLFVDVYTPGSANKTGLPTMMFIHGGGFYGGSGALYNFTNVALRGVVVVSVSYRLDIFGFLSTLDDAIPGNFGLLDQAFALDWIKSNIDKFGGDPNKITVFGGSAGAVSASFFLLSPLTQGKFQNAILQSLSGLCNYSHHKQDVDAFNYPVKISKEIGELLNCSLPAQNFSRLLLECLRKLPAEVIINQSVALQEQKYGDSLFYPVIEKTFGFLPDTPAKLLDKLDPKFYVPTIYGYTSEDGSWLVNDNENDGVDVREFQTSINLTVASLYEPADRSTVLSKALATYLPKDSLSVTKLALRDRLVRAQTDSFVVGCMVHEAQLFAAKTQSSRTYFYEFAHRPSYSKYPDWLGVAHADEKGFVLGLPLGPDPFKYPVNNAEDQAVANFIVSAWTNLAKYGDPSPQGSGLVPWPAIDPKSSDISIMQIKIKPSVKKFDRPEALDVWVNFGSSISNGMGHNPDIFMVIFFTGLRFL
ncbi:neuroligin-4, X-linked [Biomphalaria glabrata]|nr:neuroligin-4, X-linked [Biomphalaria glabrata]